MRKQGAYDCIVIMEEEYKIPWLLWIGREG